MDRKVQKILDRKVWSTKVGEAGARSLAFMLQQHEEHQHHMMMSTTTPTVTTTAKVVASASAPAPYD